jgi:uncharacterized RDD family membrane protein YckC
MGRRVVAYLIDLVLVGAIFVALLAATKDRTIVDIPSEFSDACRTIRDADGFSGQCLQLGSRAWIWTSGAVLLCWGLAALVGLLNNVILQTATGASVGKMIMGLRVVKADGETAGLGRQFGRWLMLIVDAGFCFVGFFVAAFTHPHRRLGDSLASTYVVAIADAGRPLELATGVPAGLGQQFNQAFGQQYGQPGYVPPPPHNTWGQAQPQPGGWNQAPPPQWGAAPQQVTPYQQRAPFAAPQPPPAQPQPPYGESRPQWGASQPPPQPPAYQPPPPQPAPPAYEPPPPAQPSVYEPPPPAAPPATDAVSESWWDKAVSDDDPGDDPK